MSFPKKRRGARHPAPLVAWSNGQVVGEWSVREGEHRFQYAEAWAASTAATPLSLTLPLAPDNAAHSGPAVRDWFDNLLPDSETIRKRWRASVRMPEGDAFDLLSAFGHECTGAVQMLAPGVAPIGIDRTESELLDGAGVGRVIDAATTIDRAGDAPRVAMAGAQEKTALLQREGRWFRPLNATPTTHILKLPKNTTDSIGNIPVDLHTSVENEWLCARIMRAFGLPAAHSDIATFGEHKVLVVQRFDRALQNAGTETEWIARLPQEDFCQALGMPGAQKYEADGGPGMREILRVLDASSNATADKLAFVKAQMVFWLLAATNGHAKNFSIFLERNGGYRLTPFYDVSSAWPVIGHGADQITPQKARLAMPLRSKSAHWGLTDLTGPHWDGVAKLAGLGDARALCEELAAQVPEVLRSVEAQLPADFPAALAQAIFDGMRSTVKRLAHTA